MELANIAFHADTPGRYSVLGKHMRKINLKEKVNNLFDEDKGKRAILRRYLSDVARQMDYTELNDDINDECEIEEFEETLDCTFEEPNSADSMGLHARDTDSKYLDIGYIYDSQDHSKSKHFSSSTLLSDGTVIDLVRERGDGMEVPDLADDIYNKDGSDFKRVVIGEERSNVAEFKFSYRQTYSKRIPEGPEPIGETKYRRVMSEEYANYVANQVGQSETDALQPKVGNCDYNDNSVTAKRKTAGKLKGLLKLYKLMKMKKKLAKKCIAGNLTCLTPVKSRTRLNSAFIMDTTKLEGVLSIYGNTRAGLTSVGNDRLCSDTIDVSTENVRTHSALMDNNSIDSKIHEMNAGFISNCVIHGENNNISRDTLQQTQECFSEIAAQIEEQHNIAKLGIQSKYLSFCSNTLNCSSRYDDFAYFNNGFMMD